SKVGTQTSGYTNNRNTTFTHDAAGNQTNDGNHNYTFNAENQISQMDGGAAVYAYDGEGRRMKKTVGSETTYFFYGAGGLLCEFTTTNTGAIQAASTDRTTYRTSDKLGSAVLILNASGTIIENNRTLPYGEAWLAENTPSTNDKKFTTYQRDQESGLDYAMGRYYANTNGRFVSVDPGKVVLEVPSTLNRYAYTINDPINYNDPDGQFLGFVGGFFNKLGKILGFVQSLPPIPIGSFQSTRNIGVDPKWRDNPQQQIALLLAAILANTESEQDRRYPHLKVTMDCYVKGAEPGSPGGNLFGPRRHREYEVVDQSGRPMTSNMIVREQNHVVAGTLGKGYSEWHTYHVADEIQSRDVVQQWQTFTVEILSGLDATVGPVPVMIELMDGSMVAALNVHSDRNGVIVNYDGGKVGTCADNIK
ncbi:MAG: RHS repeat-associated core domain-containing protein, partial [Acidobacteria bacterium]|nr:RHS repeat-associated core domain-containing protein [Acidobacteriota bacterium]